MTTCDDGWLAVRRGGSPLAKRILWPRTRLEWAIGVALEDSCMVLFVEWLGKAGCSADERLWGVMMMGGG